MYIRSRCPPNAAGHVRMPLTRYQVTDYVRPFNEDGHNFIRSSADEVLAASQRGDCAVIKPTNVSRNSTAPRPSPTRVTIPPTISHFVMNLPASAIEFLHNFRGVYHGHEQLFAPHTETKLPVVHVHCFAAKVDGPGPLDDFCDRIEKEIGVRLVPGDADVDGQVGIHEVRDVAPNKRMFCASFRIPAQVAFAARS